MLMKIFSFFIMIKGENVKSTLSKSSDEKQKTPILTPLIGKTRKFSRVRAENICTVHQSTQTNPTHKQKHLKHIAIQRQLQWGPTGNNTQLTQHKQNKVKNTDLRARNGNELAEGDSPNVDLSQSIIRIAARRRNTKLLLYISPSLITADLNKRNIVFHTKLTCWLQLKLGRTLKQQHK